MYNARLESIKNRTEISTKPENRVKMVTKNSDGSMSFCFGSGSTGKIDANDEFIQAFAIFSILAEV